MNKNIIPTITNTMGQYWLQPDPTNITLDNTHALMDLETFYRLPEYSASNPSGVYPGKMWKRHDGLFDPDCQPADRVWMLCWYGEVPGRPEVCSNNSRIILEAP